MTVAKDTLYIGVNDRQIDLFEGMYPVPDGMAYNSYVILDDKIAVMDTVDAGFKDEWLEKLEKALNGKTPDYLIVGARRTRLRFMRRADRNGQEYFVHVLCFLRFACNRHQETYEAVQARLHNSVQVRQGEGGKHFRGVLRWHRAPAKRL